MAALCTKNLSLAYVKPCGRKNAAIAAFSACFALSNV
jgi:hypothetical protein